jgi:hypothetical protein
LPRRTPSSQPAIPSATTKSMAWSFIAALAA